MPLFPTYASCSNKLTCECIFPCVTTRSLTKLMFRASIFMLKQHFKVVFPASFLKASSQDVSDIKDGGQLQGPFPCSTPLPSRLPSTPPTPTLPGHFCTWVLPCWYFRHFEHDIDQFFAQKQKLKIDRNIQFLVFSLNSRHCSYQMTAETVFPQIAKISMVR